MVKRQAGSRREEINEALSHLTATGPDAGKSENKAQVPGSYMISALKFPLIKCTKTKQNKIKHFQKRMLMTFYLKNERK